MRSSARFADGSAYRIRPNIARLSLRRRTLRSSRITRCGLRNGEWFYRAARADAKKRKTESKRMGKPSEKPTEEPQAFPERLHQRGVLPTKRAGSGGCGVRRLQGCV